MPRLPHRHLPFDLTPVAGVPAAARSRLTPPTARAIGAERGPARLTTEVPAHLAHWKLPREWRWGASGVWVDGYRHYQEVVDALGRSLSLVTTPDPAFYPWLRAEATALAHRSHAAIPSTFHFWPFTPEGTRGPGYLRRWIAGETVRARVSRQGADDVADVLQVLRSLGSALTALHDGAVAHGALSPDAVWITPTGRTWITWWHFALPVTELPAGVAPARDVLAVPPEWGAAWRPTAESDQWQLGTIAFALLTGEFVTTGDVPPIRLLRPDCPESIAALLDRMLARDPAARFPSVAAMLRALDRLVAERSAIEAAGGDTTEARLRWATGDDYEVLQALGSGTFGSVWRVRDLALDREVALKLLHPHVSRDADAVAHFRREAKLLAQLSHPALVQIHDWDARGTVAWYTMQLGESGSLEAFVAAHGPRPWRELVPKIDQILGGLAAAHAHDVVHRDIKPANILLDRDLRWRVADFGIARVGVVREAAGTPAFAAPEQLLGEDQGSAVDLYAIAAITAFALTGQPPYGDATDARVLLARILQGPGDFGRVVPAPIATWIRRGLAPDPTARFASATAMRLAWRDAVAAAEAEAQQGPWYKRLVPARPRDPRPRAPGTTAGQP